MTKHSECYLKVNTVTPTCYSLHRLRPRRSVRTAMAHEINMYACVQKDQMGLDKAVEEVKRERL